MVEIVFIQDISVCTAGMVPHTSNEDPTLLAKVLLIILNSQCHSLMMAVY